MYKQRFVGPFLSLLRGLLLEPSFQKKKLFSYFLCLLPRVNPFLREWIFYRGKRTSDNPAGVGVHPFEFRLADFMGVPAKGENVCLVDYSAGVFLSRMCLPVVDHLANR